MKQNLIKIAVAATLGLTALSSSAEDLYRGAWYALPGISYLNTHHDLEATNGGGGFLRLGKEISPSWDIQGGLGYNRAHEDTNIVGAGGQYTQTTLGLDALYLFSRSNVRPFVLAGVGAAHNVVDYNNIPTLTDKRKNSWLANVGVGAQYLVSDNFGLQADLRHQWTRTNARAPGTSFDAEGTIGNTLLSLGAIFRFGAPVAAPVIAAEPEPTPAPYVAPVAAVEPAPAPSPAPIPVAAPCKPKFETVTISAEKLFGFDEFNLQDGAKPILDEVVTKLKAHPEFTLVLVNGHTDRIGSENYNQKLSERRANEVKDYIVSQGVDASRLQAVGKGESEPAADCKGIKGKALIACLAPDRRVIISEQEQHQVEGATTCN